MSFSPVDHAIRHELLHDLTSNFLVEAGAGSGKTTLMVGRVVNLLRTGTATIDEIVVITFTEKAAAELASRLREALEAADQSPEIVAALDGIHRAHIQTIHGFASSILKERPVEAGIDPRLATLDNLESSLSFDLAYRRWLRDQIANPPPGLELAVRRGVRLKELKDLALALHEERAQFPLHVSPAETADIAAFLELLDDAVQQGHILERDLRNPTDNGWQRHLAIRLLHERLAAAPDDRTRERMILRSAIGGLGGAQAGWANRNVHEEQKALAGEVKERLEALQTALRAEAVTELIPVLTEFVNEYAEDRKKTSRAEFDDLLLWTRDLLRDRPDVRRYFQNRFKCLLVDEFQDTDPLQVEIVLLLTGNGPDDGKPMDLEPQPGRLFVVGDPKQSIYRFRRADIAIYHAVKTKVMAGRDRNIVQNFRSLPGVISWVNRVFGQVLLGEEGVQAEYIDLEAVPHPDVGPNVAIVPFEEAIEDGKKGNTRDRRSAEAFAAVRSLQAACGTWLVRDENEKDEEGNPKLRLAEYRDMVILVPNRTGIEQFEYAFNAQRVPFRHESGKAFFSRQEVRDLLACLRAIDDPANRIDTVAALRSAAFGCSDEDLLRYVHEGGTWEAPFPDTLVGQSLARLDAIRSERGELSLPGVVDRVLDETRLIEFVLITGQGVQAAANLRKVVDTARAFAAAQGGGLRAFVKWMAANESAKGDEADAQVAERGENVVRILTIHASKGLEFPIVLVANLNGGRSNSPTVVVNNLTQEVNAKLGSQKDGRKTPGYDEAATFEERRHNAERARLLYVAATRAADHLIIPVDRKVSSKGYLAMISPFLSMDDDIGSGYDDQHVPILPTVVELDEDGNHEIPPTADEIAAAQSAREQWQRDRQQLVDRAQGTGRPAMSADTSEVGICFAAAINALSLPSGINLDEAVSKGSADHPDLADELRTLLERCITSPVTARARQAKPTITRPTLTTPDGLPLNVDLLFVEDNAVVPVIYRLAAPDDTAAIAGSAARATGLPVREVVTVLAKTGEELRQGG